MINPPDIVNAAWLSAPETQIVFATLEDGGYRARAVGGAVRNTLMGRAVNDIDIATDAPPQEVARLCVAVGLAVHETGLQHGTVTVVSNGTPYEVTTLRTDVETDGRHATVAFTTDWSADAARRDFTINALYCDADGTIFDPLNGAPDVAAQRVRFIGDATARIKEDYLRILRFFRFSAVFGDGTLDAVGLAAVTEQQAGLDGISAERIRSELLKILLSTHAVSVVKFMNDRHFFERILGDSTDIIFFSHVVDMESAVASHVAPSAIRRLAALVGTRSDVIGETGRRLRLSNAERSQLHDCAAWDTRDLASPAAIRATLYRHGATAIEHAAVLKAASQQSREVAQAVLDISKSWPIPQLPLTGADLLAKGHKPGPALGQTLREREAAWIASDFKLTRENLIDI